MNYPVCYFVLEQPVEQLMFVCGAVPCEINGSKRPGRGADYYSTQTVLRVRRSGVTASKQCIYLFMDCTETTSITLYV